MSRILGRSRSMRILRRGGNEESHHRDIDLSTAKPTLSHADLGRLKEASFPRPDNRVETPEMLQRPSTSGGNSFSDRSPLFHMKVTPVNQLQRRESDRESIEFDTAETTATKNSSFLYTAEFQESREGIIGIALGSPTMAANPHWNASPLGNDPVTNNSQTTITRIPSNNQPTDPSLHDQAMGGNKEAHAKPKLSRWKSLFRKTAPPPRPQEKEAFYQLAKSVAPARADSHHDEDSQEEESSGISPLASNPSPPENNPLPPPPPSPKPYTYNPSIRQSRKLPQIEAKPDVDTRPRALTLSIAPPQPRPKRSPLLRSASSPKPSRFFSRSPTAASVASAPADVPPPSIPSPVVSNPKPKPYLPTPTSKKKTMPPAPISNPKPFANKPLLDVNIPEVRLERYSVMFSSLLQQHDTPSPSVPSPSNLHASSSLLQRRQAEQLKPLNQLTMKNTASPHFSKPQRRATSPALPQKSPGHFSLFPSANTSRAPSPRTQPNPLNRPRPLQRNRSQTAPSKSPVFPSVENDETIGLAITPSIEFAEEEGSTPMTATTVSSSSSRNSFELDGEEIKVVRRPTERSFAPELPYDDEPEWDILVPAPAIQRTPSRASALRSHPATTGPSSAPLEPPVTAETASPISFLRSPSSTRSDSFRSPGLRASSAAMGEYMSPTQRDAIMSPIDRAMGKSPSHSSSNHNSTVIGGATVGVARSLSVTRARSPMLKLNSPGSVKSPNGSIRSAGPVMVVHMQDGNARALTPTLVEMRNRRSQRVQLVDA